MPHIVVLCMLQNTWLHADLYGMKIQLCVKQEALLKKGVHLHTVEELENEIREDITDGGRDFKFQGIEYNDDAKTEKQAEMEEY
ncbi:hypothetical protein EMCRGX_G007732 [Ephydatia muelleri]